MTGSDSARWAMEHGGGAERAPRDPDGSVSGVDRMNVLRHWPERIVAVTDGEDSPAALIEYRKLEPGERAEPSDVEYVRADLHAGAVATDRARLEDDALRSIAEADPVDLALDPTWSQRVARDALRGQ